MENSAKTLYETEPVDSHADAICAFVNAYDVLQKNLCETGGESTAFADVLRAAMFRPVRPAGTNSPSLSLYEIGVAYVPGSPGKYGINQRKLSMALNERNGDIYALLVQPGGILPVLTEMLAQFVHPPEDAEPPDEAIRTAALRFSNECRRLIAMWV